MSIMSAPKLKTDFMNLYKGIYSSGTRKTPAGGVKPTLLGAKSDLSAKKHTLGGSREKKGLGQSHTEPTSSMNQLFRSSAKLEVAKAAAKERSIKSPTASGSLRAKTTQDDKVRGSANILFNQNALSKGKYSSSLMGFHGDLL